jgi:hypothetical protein
MFSLTVKFATLKRDFQALDTLRQGIKSDIGAQPSICTPQGVHLPDVSAESARALRSLQQ